MPNFAANLSMMFQELPFLERFEAAAKAGFKAVEFLFPYDHPAAEIRQRLDRFGLRQVLFNLPPGDWARGERGLAALPGREAEFAAGVDRAIEYAHALGCPQVHAMAGVPLNVPLEQAAATYGGNLRQAADRLQAHGLRLLIEPLNSRDMPGYFLMTAEQAREVIEAVGHPNLFLQMDLYHAQIMGGDLAERTRSHWKVIRHFQIAGVPGRHEPDVGEINYTYLFELIDSLGYDGWIGCEYRPRAKTLDGLGWARGYGIGG
jgi:hydroxypyruvate isomerase